MQGFCPLRIKITQFPGGFCHNVEKRWCFDWQVGPQDDGCIKINDWAAHYTLDVMTDVKFILYAVEPPLMATSLQWPVFSADSPYTDSCLMHLSMLSPRVGGDYPREID